VIDKPVCLIANPSAGGGRAARLLPRVEAALRGHGIGFRVERTHSIEHARELARDTIARGEIAAAMGGDGLLGALAGELRHTDGVLAVLPGGRGNDFARKLGLGNDPVAACDVLALGREQRLDVADINGRAYLGIASSGLDSDAGDLANSTRLSAKLGQLVYVYATLRAVRAWRPARWEVVIDGEPRSFAGYSVAVCNSGVFGGGMFLAPDARLDDGMLDVVMIEDLPKRKYLAALPKVFTGAHVREPGVVMARAKEVAFHADRPFNVQADGDPIADLPATVRVQPGALRVLVP
jgi:YegS/Rv2252/BmrU family lipid kinase